MARISISAAVLLVVVACGTEQRRVSEPVASVAAEPDPERDRPTAEPDATRPAQQAPNYRLLITVDDLPIAMRGGYKTDAERRETVEELVELLVKRNVPFVGFFNMGHHAHDPKLTTTWLTADKMVIGNHTWSHPNAEKTSLATYLADLTRGHRAVAKLRPKQDKIPFRFPYLDQGFDPKKRAAIFARLTELDSRHIPVTIDTKDWLYARGYLRALHKGDESAAGRYHRAWIWDIQERTLYAEQLAMELFGRLPPQILLLHANRLNADHLDEALDWYQERGYRFVTLEETMADEAYDEVDNSFSPTGDNHWLRLQRSRDLAERPLPQ